MPQSYHAQRGRDIGLIIPCFLLPRGADCLHVRQVGVVLVALRCGVEQEKGGAAGRVAVVSLAAVGEPVVEENKGAGRTGDVLPR